MVKDGAAHFRSLQDGRAIYIDGKVVTDHVSHPAFAESIRSVCSLYDFQARPENLDLMTFESPKTGDRVNRTWQLPKSYAELVQRRRALESWAEQHNGFLGRSPDHVGSMLGGMVMGLDVFKEHGDRYANNLKAYYEHARDNDLYLTYVIINPQADRSKTAGGQSEDLIAKIVDEDHEGITIKGSKMLGTGCPMANEVFVSTIQPLKAGEEPLSYSFAIPLATKGLKMLSRKSYEAQSGDVFDNPLSSRYDENDAVLYFDEVKVPWDRVFTIRSPEMAGKQWHATPAHVYQNYQCQIRFMVKMRFLLGIARKVAETNGIIAFPPVVETLGQMAAEVSMVEGLVEAMEASGRQVGEYYVPNGQRLYAANVLTQQLYPKFIASIRELSGGGMIMLPSSADDFANPEIASVIQQSQKSPATDSLGRVKLFKLAWDAVGSEFGSRHLQYEMFYSGATMVTRGHAYRTYNWQRALGAVDRFLGGYGLPAQPAAASSAPVTSNPVKAAA